MKRYDKFEKIEGRFNEDFLRKQEVIFDNRLERFMKHYENYSTCRSSSK